VVMIGAGGHWGGAEEYAIFKALDQLAEARSY